MSANCQKAVFDFTSACDSWCLAVCSSDLELPLEKSAAKGVGNIVLD